MSDYVSICYGIAIIAVGCVWVVALFIGLLEVMDEGLRGINKEWTIRFFGWTTLIVFGAPLVFPVVLLGIIGVGFFGIARIFNDGLKTYHKHKTAWQDAKNSQT